MRCQLDPHIKANFGLPQNLNAADDQVRRRGPAGELRPARDFPRLPMEKETLISEGQIRQ
jgi:hypothetical protein